jgi:hypothetical protein
MNILPLIAIYSLILIYLIWELIKVKNKNTDLLEEQDRIVKGWARAATNFRHYKADLDQRLEGCQNEADTYMIERDLLDKEFKDLVHSYKKLKEVCHEQGQQLQRLSEQYTILFNKAQPHDL